jgi:hypothetical protein
VKSWQKGAIVGAIWGPLSGIYLFLTGICGYGGSCPPRPFLESIFGKVFVIPVTWGMAIHVTLFGESLVGTYLNLILPLIAFPSIIGAVLIGGIVYLIDRWRSSK